MHWDTWCTVYDDRYHVAAEELVGSVAKFASVHHDSEDSARLQVAMQSFSA